MPVAKVLLVEDEISHAEVLRMLLGAAGFEVVHASNGVDALALLEREKPDLIITDYMMPKMTGGELAKEVRTTASNRTIPILVVSASDEQEINHCSKHFDAFLRKPYRWEDLIQAVGNLTRFRAQRFSDGV